MQRDKANLTYAGKPQLARAMELLTPLVARCFVSVRSDQLQDPQRAAYDTIADVLPNLGPIGGIHAALHAYPDRAWLVLACDLPFLDAATLQHLIAHRRSTRVATAYRSSFDGQPEPLCAIFEPRSRAAHRAGA
jgi:molybdopterin-guanine dinucleotide biosynthesis protein A